MWSFSARALLAFGCLNALTIRASNLFCKKQTFAGSSSTRTACCLETRVRVAQFLHLVIRQPGRPRLRAIAIPVGRFGAHKEVILAILSTGSFIETPDSIFHWNIWDRLLTAPENFPV